MLNKVTNVTLLSPFANFIVQTKSKLAKPSNFPLGWSGFSFVY